MIPFFSAPSLALSYTFYDCPSYCSEMDKNNMLFCGQRVFPVERSWVHWVQGVRRAPQTQEGSTLSHSQGCQGWTLVFLLRPSPLTLSIINISITIDLSNLMGGMSGQKHVSSMLFNWHEFGVYKYTGL